MEGAGKDQTKYGRGEVVVMLALYALLFPLIEISILIQVIATVIDPLFPELTSALGLIAPPLMILVISVAVAMFGSRSELRKVVAYLLMAIMAIISMLIAVEGIMFPGSIAGFVVDSNLWSLVTLNIIIYFLAVVLTIVGIGRSQPAE